MIQLSVLFPILPSITCFVEFFLRNFYSILLATVMVFAHHLWCFQWSMSFRAKCFIRFSLWKQHYFQFSSTNKIITENNVVEFFSSLFCTLNRNQIAGVCVFEWLALFRWIYKNKYWMLYRKAHGMRPIDRTKCWPDRKIIEKYWCEDNKLFWQHFFHIVDVDSKQTKIHLHARAHFLRWEWQKS